MDGNTKLDPKTDLRTSFERFSPKNMAANRPVVDLLKQVATRKGATPSQVALAWLLAQKPFIVPIPGTRNSAHLNENHGALKIELTADDLQGMRAELSRITIHGGRMNEPQMELVDTTA
jgi:aryl-alcohol dehydrogenase-like predicted oxidoreductase